MRDSYQVLLLRAARPTLELIEEMEKGASPALAEVLAEIRRRLFESGFTVADLMAKFRTSYKRLAMSFRSHVGLTTWQLIRESRLETAARLLRDTSMLIADVVLYLGYSAESSFGRSFEGWCGMRPSEFRTRARRLRPLMSALPADVLSWAFWERVRRRELSAAEVRALVEYLEQVYDLAPAA